MGVLGDIWICNQQAKADPVLDEDQVDNFLKGIIVFLEAIKQQGALESFDFVHCGMDSGKHTLYANIGFGPQSDSNMVIPLTRDDLDELQAVVAQLKDWKLEDDVRQAVDRTIVVIDKALLEMDVHEKTAEWVRQRDGISKYEVEAKQLLKAAGVHFS